ncbi:cytochrome C [Leptolyngbya valderiana BDU 20041]|nr:cytochrome C [Leptolyngbya valderiana BDU 20041]
MKRFLIPALLIAAGLAVGLFVFLQRPGPSQAVLQPADTEIVQLGAEIYAAECAACHGAELEGQANWRTRRADGRLPAPPHDPSGHTWHHPDAHLFAMTKLGVQALVGPDYESDMPAYGETLSDREIMAVLSYIKSTWPEEIQARHDEINRRFDAQN